MPQPPPTTAILPFPDIPRADDAADDLGRHLGGADEAREFFDLEHWHMERAHRVLAEAHAKLRELHAERLFRLSEGRTGAAYRRTEKAIAETANGLLDLWSDGVGHVMQKQAEAEAWIAADDAGDLAREAA